MRRVEIIPTPLRFINGKEQRVRNGDLPHSLRHSIGLPRSVAVAAMVDDRDTDSVLRPRIVPTVFSDDVHHALMPRMQSDDMTSQPGSM